MISCLNTDNVKDKYNDEHVKKSLNDDNVNKSFIIDFLYDIIDSLKDDNAQKKILIDNLQYDNAQKNSLIESIENDNAQKKILIESMKNDIITNLRISNDKLTEDNAALKKKFDDTYIKCCSQLIAENNDLRDKIQKASNEKNFIQQENKISDVDKLKIRQRIISNVDLPEIRILDKETKKCQLFTLRRHQSETQISQQPETYIRPLSRVKYHTPGMNVQQQKK